MIEILQKSVIYIVMQVITKIYLEWILVNGRI